MPTYGSVTERIRDMNAADSELAASWDKRLDAIEEKKAKAIPVIGRHIDHKEQLVASLENDAKALEKLASELSNSPSPTPAQPGSGNGSAQIQIQNGGHSNGTP